MDATVLYMMVKLANGVEYAVMATPLKTSGECAESARRLASGRIANRYRLETGGEVTVYCAPPQKAMVIAR